MLHAASSHETRREPSGRRCIHDGAAPEPRDSLRSIQINKILATQETEMPPVSCKEHDFLEQDQTIRGQNYVCLSFLSPSDAVASREAFAVSRFLSAFSTEANQVLEDAKARASSEEDKKVLENLRDRYSYVFDKDMLKSEYDQYCSTYSEQIQKDWSEENDNGACVYGIKIRGAYETLPEAQTRAQSLKRSDPNFSVYVCEMGCWVPWSPNPDEIKDAEYSETQLNTLMKKYKENMTLKDEYYEARKRELVKAAEADASSASETVAGGEGTSFSAEEGTSSASEILAAIE